MNCPLCDIFMKESHYDDQPSLLTCPVILKNKKLKTQIENITYSDIFKSVEVQVPAIRVLEKIVNYRQHLLLASKK